EPGCEALLPSAPGGSRVLHVDTGGIGGQIVDRSGAVAESFGLFEPAGTAHPLPSGMYLWPGQETLDALSCSACSSGRCCFATRLNPDGTERWSVPSPGSLGWGASGELISLWRDQLGSHARIWDEAGKPSADAVLSGVPAGWFGPVASVDEKGKTLLVDGSTAAWFDPGGRPAATAALPSSEVDVLAPLIGGGFAVGNLID